jgi:uncharacterized cupredoxin-like copper-binding protein
MSGCRSNGEGADGATEAAATPAPSAIDVGLSYFQVTVSSDVAAEGTVTFRVTNEENDSLSFFVIQTDLDADELPVNEETGTVQTEELNVISEIEFVYPSQAAEIGSSLTAGNYVLICNVPSHYASGMRASMEVE